MQYIISNKCLSMDLLRKILGDDYYYCTYDPRRWNENYKCHGPYKSFEEADKESWNIVGPGTLINAKASLPNFIQEYLISHRMRPKVHIITNINKDEK